MDFFEHFAALWIRRIEPVFKEHQQFEWALMCDDYESAYDCAPDEFCKAFCEGARAAEVARILPRAVRGSDRDLGFSLGVYVSSRAAFAELPRYLGSINT